MALAETMLQGVTLLALEMVPSTAATAAGAAQLEVHLSAACYAGSQKSTLEAVLNGMQAHTPLISSGRQLWQQPYVPNKLPARSPVVWRCSMSMRSTRAHLRWLVCSTSSRRCPASLMPEPAGRQTGSAVCFLVPFTSCQV